MGSDRFWRFVYFDRFMSVVWGSDKVSYAKFGSTEANKLVISKDIITSSTLILIFLFIREYFLSAYPCKLSLHIPEYVINKFYDSWLAFLQRTNQTVKDIRSTVVVVLEYMWLTSVTNLNLFN